MALSPHEQSRRCRFSATHIFPVAIHQDTSQGPPVYHSVVGTLSAIAKPLDDIKLHYSLVFFTITPIVNIATDLDYDSGWSPHFCSLKTARHLPFESAQWPVAISFDACAPNRLLQNSYKLSNNKFKKKRNKKKNGFSNAPWSITRQDLCTGNNISAQIEFRT